jgi:type IX secretion system PorP/SprF family membrane protein
VPYNTFDIFADVNLGRNIYSRNYYSLGMNIIADRAGDGALTVTKLIASGAYHFILDRGKSNDLSIGAQLGYVQKKIDFTKLYFDSQWNDSGFDTQLSNGENYKDASTSYPDAALGISYSYTGGKKVSANAGFAVYHLIKPHDSFYGADNKLGTRPVFNVGINYTINDQVSIAPSIYYEAQKKASEFLTGAMLQYDISKDPEVNTKLFLGFYGRIKDALIPAAGFEITHWRFIMNYDINTSELKPASHGKGAFEISLIYIGTSKKNNRPGIDMPCPRF